MRPAPGRDARRRRGRPADSARRRGTAPSGETFSRPSSVRRMTSGRDADAVGRGEQRRDLVAVLRVARRTSAARRCARTSRISDVGILVGPALAHAENFLGGARENLRDEMQDVADAEIDRDRIPRRADAERIDMLVLQGSPPCRAAAARRAARPRPDRRRPPPSRSADDNCASRTETSCRRSAAPAPRALRSATTRASARAETIGSRISPSAASAIAA